MAALPGSMTIRLLDDTQAVLAEIQKTRPDLSKHAIVRAMARLGGKLLAEKPELLSENLGPRLV